MIRNRGIKVHNDFHRIIENCSTFDPKDVTLCCNDREIDAHRDVLMAYSPYFLDLLENRPAENLVIALNKVDGDILKYVLKFMYKGKVRVAKDEMDDFNKLLKRFRMPVPEQIGYGIEENINVVINNKYETRRANSEVFILMFRTILDKLNGTNADELSHAFQAANRNITPEQNETIIRMVLQKVSQVSLNPVNSAALASFMFGIRQTHSLDSFDEKLHDWSIDLFRDSFNHIPSQCSCSSDSNNISTLDQQVNHIANANFHMAPYRNGQIAHFIEHLYLLNLIEATDICSIIELCESKVDSVDVNAILRAMAGTLRKIHFEITTDDAKLERLTHDELQMLHRTVSRTKLIWAFCGDDKSCCNIQMSNDVRQILVSPWYSGIQSTIEHMNWTRFSAHQFLGKWL